VYFAKIILFNIHVIVFYIVERNSSSTNCILNTVDGLLPLVDDVQNRLRQLNLEHKVNIFINYKS